MPNHVTNRLQFFGSDQAVAAIKHDIKSATNADHLVDFNRIRPMPQELRGTLSGSNDILPDEGFEEAIAERKAKHETWAKEWSEKTGKPAEEFGASLELPVSKSQAADYIRRFGAYNWYDWSRNNWGTKWGAYNTRQDEEHSHILYYQTAWSCGAIDLLREFSQRHPTVTIVHEWADEDTGCNTGRRVWRNGELSVAENADDSGYYDNSSVEAYRTAFMLTGGRENYRRTKPGERYTYKYIDLEDYDPTYAWERDCYGKKGETQEQIEARIAKLQTERQEELDSCVTDEQEEEDKLECNQFAEQMMVQPEVE